MLIPLRDFTFSKMRSTRSGFGSTWRMFFSCHFISIHLGRNNVTRTTGPDNFFKRETRMKKMLIVCILACMFCGCTHAQRSTATGAAIGAGVGAVGGAAVGAATDGSDEAVVTGAVVGGATGAVVGGVIGHESSRRR